MKRWRISIYLTSWAISFNQESTLYRGEYSLQDKIPTENRQDSWRGDRTENRQDREHTGQLEGRRTENRQDSWRGDGQKADRTAGGETDREQTGQLEGRWDREQTGQRTDRTADGETDREQTGQLEGRWDREQTGQRTDRTENRQDSWRRWDREQTEQRTDRTAGGDGTEWTDGRQSNRLYKQETVQASKSEDRSQGDDRLSPLISSDFFSTFIDVSGSGPRSLIKCW